MYTPVVALRVIGDKKERAIITEIATNFDEILGAEITLQRGAE